MATWKRKPQEHEGAYRFSGIMHVTSTVLAELSVGEITAIYLDIQTLVGATGAIDYLQVYENEVGDKLYFIDQCDAEMMNDPSFKPENNYCTLLFSHEY